MMGSEKDREKEKKMIVGVIWNCAAELKYVITAFIVIFSIVTVVQFLPTRFSLSAADLRSCLSSTSLIQKNATSSSSSAGVEKAIEIPPPPPLIAEVAKNGIIKRSFNPYGSAAYNFILMSAYRGGPNTFAVMGLASKPLMVYGKPNYQCQWVPNGVVIGEIEEPIITTGEKILPDWGYGRVYTVLVVNCTFSSPINGSTGGKLLLHATTNGGGDSISNTTDIIEALTETGEDFAKFNEVYSAKPKYDYLYCGSSLYGNLSPQRVREWLAYHIRLLGGNAHFVIHDAGGAHEEVMEVLRPWMEKGYVTLQDIRDQERFDGYYHNQFLIVNDCLHRYRFMTKWMLFFDVDEFLYVPKKSNLRSVLRSLSEYTQFTIEQMPMSNRLCLAEDSKSFSRKWGFEKLVFKDTKRGIRRDRKYAVQPRTFCYRRSYVTEHGWKDDPQDRGAYNVLSLSRDHCQPEGAMSAKVNTTGITVDGIPYSVDDSMRNIAGFVKRFELNTIGPILQRTRQ